MNHYFPNDLFTQIKKDSDNNNNSNDNREEEVATSDRSRINKSTKTEKNIISKWFSHKILGRIDLSSRNFNQLNTSSSDSEVFAWDDIFIVNSLNKS